LCLLRCLPKPFLVTFHSLTCPSAAGTRDSPLPSEGSPQGEQGEGGPGLRDGGGRVVRRDHGL
jgi:hypothetical protein